MYLYARKYVSEHGYERNVNGQIERVESTDVQDIIEPQFPAELNKFADWKQGYIMMQIGYWRKANQIHSWFVENVQGGEDDCREYRVDRDELQSLFDTVEKVLMYRTEEMALEELPPAQGFFFGSNEIDEWYWEQLQYTHDMLKNILDTVPENAEIAFVYTSSW